MSRSTEDAIATVQAIDNENPNHDSSNGKPEKRKKLRAN